MMQVIMVYWFTEIMKTKTVKAKVLKVKFQNLGENGAEAHFKWEHKSGCFIPHEPAELSAEAMPWD